MKRIVFMSVAIGAVLLLLSLLSPGSIGTDGPLQITITPTAFVYLPFIAKESAPPGAPTAIPASTPTCLLYTSPSPRDRTRSRMPSSA